MHKEFIFFIKYPYTAGVIATIWIGSAILMILGNSDNDFKILLSNVFVTVVVALVGFGGRSNA